MSNVLHNFLEAATRKAAADLTEALHALPEDKRGWQPGGKTRTALDQVAECAILNGYTASVIQNRKWPSGGYDEYLKEKETLVESGEAAVLARLRENLEKIVAVIRTVDDASLQEVIELPWGPQCLSEMVGYPFWNMTYHLGQLNYINVLREDAN